MWLYFIIAAEAEINTGIKVNNANYLNTHRDHQPTDRNEVCNDHIQIQCKDRHCKSYDLVDYKTAPKDTVAILNSRLIRMANLF